MTLEMEILLGVALLLAGGGIGFMLGRTTGPARRRVGELEEELKQSKAREEAYRDDVAEHFLKTAGLVNEMTASYRAVYAHIVGGAKRLANMDSTRLAMEQPGSRIIEGQRRPEPLREIPPNEPPRAEEVETAAPSGEEAEGIDWAEQAEAVPREAVAGRETQER